MITQNTNNRLSPSILNSDQDIFQALQTIPCGRKKRHSPRIRAILPNANGINSAN
ncbi:hypothetical protein [Stenomitos frigidus]|uniref:hypothetical protein n=1 Tax=Stenomitos frigidus TaxID=1886765 RepID=UPI0015E6AD2D|nr:hypothetical protein [Stenomitos frigidus]